MIYISTLVIILCLVYKYDIEEETKYKERWYKGLAIWFIMVSGFAYNVGSDIPEYMDFYDSMSPNKFMGWKNLFNSDRYQPGWYLLNIGCRLISDDFVVIKFIMAMFVNGTIFWFIKRHCDKIFLSVFFFAILIYLDLNFNALRQAVALSFFLIGFDFLSKKKWCYYVAFLLVGYLFHSSIIALIPLLIIPYIKLNKVTVLIIIGCLFSLFYFVLFMNFADLLLIYATDVDISEEWSRSSMAYLANQEEITINANGISRRLIEIVMYTIIAYVSIKLNATNRKRIDSIMLVIYVILLVLCLAVPVVFFRFLMYIKIFYACVMADMLVHFSKVYFRRNKTSVCFILIFLFTLFPIKAYFEINPSSEILLIKQYAPYYSVFNKHIDPIRSANFGYHK